MGLDLKAIQEKRTNLNAQEIGDDAERAKQWKRFDRNPVFDEAELDQDRESRRQAADRDAALRRRLGLVQRLGRTVATPHTTAVVVHGLQIAKQNDVALVPGMLERGVAWLKTLPGRASRALATSTKRQADRQEQAVEAARRRPRRAVYMVLVDADVEQRRDAATSSTATAPNSPSTARRMFGLALDKQQRSRKARDGHAEHRPVRGRGRREPNRLSQPARRQLLVVLVRQRVSRPTPTT